LQQQLQHPQQQQQQQSATSNESFYVTISASGRDPRDPTRIIHAISISQPVTSWTVVREYDDFVQVGNKISMVNPSLPPCPSLPDRASAGSGSSSITTNDTDEIVHVRNVLQEWLISVLLFPGARESPALRHFMTFGANQVPPQLEGTVWLHFTVANNNTSTKGVKHSPTTAPNTSSIMNTGITAARSSTTINTTPSNTSVRGSSNATTNSGPIPAAASSAVRTSYADVVAATSASSSISPSAPARSTSSPSSTTAPSRQQQQHTHNISTLDDEMEMDFMFDTGGSGGDEEDDDDDDSDYGDDELIIPYAQRYPPPDEVVTQEDVELMESLEEIEMIEDVGSLAQSLGASHLGRSLQLQAQITRQNLHPHHYQQQQPHLASAAPPTMSLTGMSVEGTTNATNTNRPVVPSPGGGGIEGAIMKNIGTSGIPGLGDSFFQQKPISAPRLDSFKMIKVIGKGSFGKLSRMLVNFFLSLSY
jgi:hypothetical protein